MSRYTDLIRGYPFGKPKFEKTVDSTTQFYVDIQNFLSTFSNYFNLDSAIGNQLDILGEWIGRNRYLPTPVKGVFFSLDDEDLGFNLGIWLGRFDSETGLTALDDDTYRTILKAQIAANNWDGTNESLSDLLALFFEENYNLFFHDNQDMSMDIAVGSGVMPPLLLAFLTTMEIPFRPDGVWIKYFIVGSKDSPIFGFDVENELISGFNTGSWGTIYQQGKTYAKK